MHGGVDGFTRLSVYLTAGDNNKAETVLSLFLQAVAEFGLPSRVRSDKCGCVNVCAEASTKRSRQRKYDCRP